LAKTKKLLTVARSRSQLNQGEIHLIQSQCSEGAKLRRKETGSGKKSKVTAVVGAQLAQVGDAANETGNEDAERMVSALAEAISEYESDFESGEDSDSELMTNPLSTDQISDNPTDNQSTSELKVDLNSDDESDDTGDELDECSEAFDNDDKFVQNIAQQPQGSDSAQRRRVSEGGDMPSPQSVSSGRKHTRVKSDVTSSIHLPHLGQDQNANCARRPPGWQLEVQETSRWC
jgi:hypothetical protein